MSKRHLKHRPKPSEDHPEILSLPASPGPLPWTAWQIVALVALAVLGFAADFTKIADPDIFWQLACGEWMFRNHQVMGQDVFSLYPNSDGWVNVHWIFQIIVTSLYKLGGWGLLSVFKSVMGAALMIGVFFTVRRRLHPAAIVLIGMAIMFLIHPRLRERPELFTMLLVIVTLGLVESVRCGASPRRLWWMVPIMIFWVNVHGLFFLGLVVLWIMIAGAAADKAVDRWGKGVWLGLSAVFAVFVGLAVYCVWIGHNAPVVVLGLLGGGLLFLGRKGRSVGMGDNLLSTSVLLPAGVATLACLISPWPIGAVLNPLVLSSRLTSPIYANTVAELGHTLADPSSYMDAFALIVLTAIVMVVNFRNVPLGHLGLAAAFTVLGLLSHRNLAIMALVLGVVLAFGVGDVLRRVRRRNEPDELPAPRKEAIPVVLASLLAIVMSVGYATGAIQHLTSKDSYSGLPGAGLLKENCCDGAAKFLRDLDVEGDLLCGQFGDGGVFEYYFNHDRDKPKRRVYMDGRLEAHTLEKYQHNLEMTRGLMKGSTASIVSIDSSIRFVMVANQPGALPQLVGVAAAQLPGGWERSQDRHRFRLIYLDHSGALFERMDWEAPPDMPDRVKIPSEPDWAAIDLPLGRDGRIGGGAAGTASGTWYDQDVLPVDALLGTELLVLGTQAYFRTASQESPTPPSSADSVQQKCVLLANRYLTAAAQRSPEWAAGLAPLAQAYGQRAWQQFIEPSETLPIDIDSACSLSLYQQIAPRQLSGPKVAAQHYMDCLLHSNMRDEALAPGGALLQRGDGWQGDWMPSMRGLDPRALAGSLELARNKGVLQLPLLQRARTLVRDYGLINEAISQLESPGDDWGGQCHMLLGDLLLRKGLPSKARQAYTQVTLAEDQAWQLSLRLALCDWVEGKLWKAADDLKALSTKCDQVSVKFYRLHLAELLGDVATVKAYAEDPEVKALLPIKTNRTN
jgi:hypothetical protein